MLSRTLTAIAAVVLATMTAAAQPMDRASLADPRLDALVTEALKNAPEMTAAKASVEAAQRRVEPARTPADPMLFTTYQNDGRAFSFGAASGTFLGLMASEAIPWPGKLKLAGDVAASEAKEVERGTLGRTGLTLEARVRNAWYDLVLARAVDKIIDDRRTAATQIEASVRERYAAGLGVQQDVLRAEIELARLDEQKAAQAALIESRLAELNRLTGAPQDRPIATPDHLPDVSELPATSQLIAAAEARSPEIAATAQAIETGRLRVAVAKKNFLPDFTVNAGSMYRGSFAMGPMWQVGVGVTLPVWSERRQQNQLAEAEALVRGKASENDAARQELELRTRERVAQLDASLRIAALYRDKVLPLDDVSLESALASYQAGKVPFITVLDALNSVYNDRATYAARLAESAKWRVAIDEASLSPTAMGGTPSMAAASSMAPALAATPAASNASSSMSSMR